MSGDRTVHIYSRMARALYCVLLTLAILATLGGMFDPTPGPDQPKILPGAVFLAFEVILFFRSLRIGLTIDPHRVTSRGLVRTRQFPRPAVTQITATGYIGVITRGVVSGLFMMLKLEVAGSPVELPQLIGRAKAVRGLADEAQGALALPQRTAPRGKFRRRVSRAQGEPAERQDPS